MQGLIYVAAPYYSTDKAVTQARMEAIYDYMGEQMKQGVHCITPLSMHEVVLRHELPGDFKYWQDYCFNLLARCDRMDILMLDGWDKSNGIKGEIEFCKANDIDYGFINWKNGRVV